MKRLLLVGAIFTASLVGAPQPVAAVDAGPSTVVSVTFDDGLANQLVAASIMDAAGMDGTFYVNSGRIGSSSKYMTRIQLEDLAAAGHEIGGHSISHLNLPALTQEGQRRQICNDRNTLMSWGFGVKNFAYPFSAFDATTKSMVAECGYVSARRVSDLASQNACIGCAVAETRPPRDPLEIRTPDSIKVDTTMDSLKGYVTQAENGGGGWVPLVFHNICDGCDPNAITPAAFQEFITWLDARPASTAVMRVQDVMGGQVNPAPPIVPPGAGTSELQNPGLELDANGDSQADCWQRASFGTNIGTFTRTTDARSGAAAERIDLTSYTTGAKRLVVRQDDGACSPGLVGGDRATISVWYKSSASVRFSVFYRDPGDAWRPWITSSSFPASATWAQATYTTPALPSTGIGISFGLNLQAVGYLVTDDYAMTVERPDTVAPEIGLLAPTEGETVSGRAVQLAAVASDEVTVSKVDFLVNDIVVGTDLTAPYGVTWDSTTVADGPVTVKARATDTSNNVTSSSGTGVTVSNASPTFGLTNGNLERDDDRDGLADCWQRAGTGTNSYAFTRTVDGRSGGFAEQVDITSYTSGSRRLVVRQDTGQCAVPVEPGRPYLLSAWVKGTAPARLSAFYRSAAGAWVTWASGPLVATSDTWSQLAWTTPAVPDGATHVSFGVSLAAVGSITVDDHAIARDETPPAAALTSPPAGATVAGSVALAASASDDVRIGRVDFLVEGSVVGTDTTAPYGIAWDSAGVANGPVAIAARATDTSGNSTTSATVTVTVDNSASGWGVRNASLELDADSNGVPDCWQASGSGTNTVAYSRTNDARTGSFAESVEITAYTSGGRRLVSRLDAGACAVSVVEGGQYTISAWAKGTGTVRMTAFWRIGGAWSTSTVNGPTAAAAADWSLLSWTTTAPAGATHISFGVTLQSVGAIVVDDHAISGPVPDDASPPTVQLTAPAPDTIVSGATVRLAATATDDRAIETVEFLVDGLPVGSDTAVPYELTWDSTMVPDGSATIVARAIDTSGNATASTAATVTVDNTGPVVSVAAPTAGAIVRGSVTLSADATDPAEVGNVEFLVGGAVVGDDATAPYSISWNSTAAPDGAVAVTARAVDGQGNGTISAPVSITIDNVDTAPPVVSLTAPASGATVSGRFVTISATATDDVAVATVEFLVDGNVVGRDTTVPYSMAWDSTTVADGSRSLTARAIDTSGNARVSSVRLVTVRNGVDSAPPSVSISAPAGGSFVGGASVTISALASDVSGVASVEFLVGGVSVGTDTTAPYSIAWNATTAAEGPASITARARDNAGNTGTSPAVAVTVDNTLPTVSLTAPVDGAAVAGAVTITASAADANGVRVEFLVNGQVVMTDSTAPTYNMTWDSTTTPSGPVTIGARAVDAAGNIALSTVTVTVMSELTPPTVSRTAPAAGVSVAGTVTISAAATDASGIARVDFLVDDVLVGSDTTAPYSTAWNTTARADGPASLVVRATDVPGNVATTVAASVTVRNAPPAVQNASFEADSDVNGVPDCWQPAGSGRNTVSYARVTTARTGSFAERITVSAFQNGRRSLEVVRDAGTCSIPIAAGRRYTVGAWYQSNAQVRLTVVYRTTSGAWSSLGTSSASPASAGWRQILFSTTALPSTATHLSFAIEARSNIVLTADDFSIALIP